MTPKRGSEVVVAEQSIEDVLPLRTLAKRALAGRAVDYAAAVLPDMPGVDSEPEPPPARDDGLPPVPALDGHNARLVLLIGPSAGKTTFARAVISDLTEAKKIAGTLVCAADPGPRSLAKFLPPGGVHVPASTSDRDGLLFWRDVSYNVESEDRPRLTIGDCGAGHTSFFAHLEAVPDQFDRWEAAGVATAVLWFFTPRTDDLAVLRAAMAKKAFRPTAQAAVLNLAKAQQGWPSFLPLRAQPDYLAMQRAGGGEVWMPALAEDVALEIERKALPFHMARDGKVPKGRDPKDAVEGNASTAVSLWMPRWRGSLGPVKGWVS